MVLPLLRITQGKKGVGMGARGHGGRVVVGGVTEALHCREQDLRKKVKEREAIKR